MRPCYISRLLSKVEKEVRLYTVLLPFLIAIQVLIAFPILGLYKPIMTFMWVTWEVVGTFQLPTVEILRGYCDPLLGIVRSVEVGGLCSPILGLCVPQWGLCGLL